MWRAPVIFRCIVIARIDLKRLLQLLHIALISKSGLFSIMVLPICPPDDVMDFFMVNDMALYDIKRLFEILL